LRTEEEAIAWLGTERSNLHACVSYAASHGHLAHAIRIPIAMSGFLHFQGHWNEAVTLGRAALAAARTVGDQHAQARTLTQLGVAQKQTGDYPGAAASLTRALQLSRDLGDRQIQACALNLLGVVQQQTGDYRAAAASSTQALQLFGGLGDRHGQAVASISLGELLLLSRAPREARDYFAQALSTARDINAPALEAQALEGIGRSHIREGNPGQGAAHLRQALAVYQRLGAAEAQRVEKTLLSQQ
jgi:tetratricopeptide (TPR) repeat protein